MKALLSIIFITIIIIIPPFSFATDSTPSADIRVKLEELKKEIASKAAKLKEAATLKLQNKAYIGQVKTKSQSSLTLSTKTGPKIVNINQDTDYVSDVKLKTKYSQKTLSEEDFVAALGDVDDNGVLTAKKVILTPQAKGSPKTFVWGQVVSMADTLITVKAKDLKNIAVSIAEGIDQKFRLGDFIILTGRFNKNEIFEADFVYPIPQGGIIKPKKIATPSAQTSTPSGKKK